MTTGNGKPGLLAKLGDWLDRRQHALRELKELDGAGPLDIERMAAGVGMSVDELADVIASGDQTSELVRRMMAAHGVDRDWLAEILPELVEDIETRCNGCEHRHRCEVELNAGTAAAHAAAFCVNAATMRELADGV